MAATIKIENFSSLNIRDKTGFATDYPAGTTVFGVDNVGAWVSGDFFAAGQLGSEGCEILIVDTVDSPTQITTTTASKFAHKRAEELTLLLGTKIKIYTAPNATGAVPPDESFTYQDFLVNIKVDQLLSSYTDGNGSSAVWYKFTYFNDVSEAETSLADSGAARGGGYGHYTTVDAIRADAGFSNNRNISDAFIDSCRIDAEAEVNGELAGIYQLPFTAPVPDQVNEITKGIAVGLLLLKEYGPMATGTNKEGSDKLKDARALLTQYKTREKTILDAEGVSLILTGATGFSSWPNETTAALSEYEHGGANLINMKHHF